MASMHRLGEFLVQGGGGRKDLLDGLRTGLRREDYNAGPWKESRAESESKDDQRLNHALRIGMISNHS